RRREAMEHDRHPLRPVPEDRKGVLLRLTGVDDDGQLQTPRKVDLRLERASLILARREVAEVVEAGLADRAHALVARRPLDRLDASVVEPLGLVRVAADDREDLLVGIRRRERALDRRVVDPHGRKPTHARRYRALDHLAVGRLAVVEMAVAVDHGTAAAPGSGEL